MRPKVLFTVILLFSCAKKVLPPGKGEFKGPKLILFSPENGDTIRDTLRLYAYAEDSSGVSSFAVSRRGEILATFAAKGKSYSLDTFLILPKGGDTLLPDTLTVVAKDIWDNPSKLDVEVFTYRERIKKVEK